MLVIPKTEEISCESHTAILEAGKMNEKSAEAIKVDQSQNTARRKRQVIELCEQRCSLSQRLYGAPATSQVLRTDSEQSRQNSKSSGETDDEQVNML